MTPAGSSPRGQPVGQSLPQCDHLKPKGCLRIRDRLNQKQPAIGRLQAMRRARASTRSPEGPANDGKTCFSWTYRLVEKKRGIRITRLHAPRFLNSDDLDPQSIPPWCSNSLDCFVTRKKWYPQTSRFRKRPRRFMRFVHQTLPAWTPLHKPSPALSNGL